MAKIRFVALLFTFFFSFYSFCFSDQPSNNSQTTNSTKDSTLNQPPEIYKVYYWGVSGKSLRIHKGVCKIELLKGADPSDANSEKKKVIIKYLTRALESMGYKVDQTTKTPDIKISFISYLDIKKDRTQLVPEYGVTGYKAHTYSDESGNSETNIENQYGIIGMKTDPASRIWV